MPLEAPLPDGQTLVFPLERTCFALSVAGPLARVEVTQHFRNPLKGEAAMEVRYVFPLPPQAAVDGMKATFGWMEIVGELKKRAEAIATYEAARAEGRAAALLEREREDLFVQQLANVLPGEEVCVQLTFTLPLRYLDGAYVLTLPLVAGQRFTGPDEAPSQEASAPRLRPHESNLHRIEVSGVAHGGEELTSVSSPSHPAAMGQHREGELWRFALGGLSPDRELVLRFAVAGGRAKPMALAQADERGGHAMALLVPPLAPSPQEVLPQDFVFLMDTSGSQAGVAFQRQQEVIRRLLRALHPADTFNVVDFADRATKLAARPWPAEPARVEAAIAYVDQLEAKGGTDLRAGVQEILALPAAPGGRLRSFVLLTDGLIGADREVLAMIRAGLKPGQRLHAFGVGSGINHFLLERLADLGRGAYHFLADEGAWGFPRMGATMEALDAATDAMLARFLARVRTPLLRDLSLRWEGPGEVELWPERPKDLLAGEPVVVHLRVDGAAEGRLILEGEQADGQRHRSELAIAFPAGGGPEAVAKAFGQARLAGLALQSLGALGPAQQAEQEATALAYGLASEWTAFVATASEVRLGADGIKRRVAVPLSNPAGGHGDDGLAQEGGAPPDLTRRKLAGPPPPSGLAPAPAMMKLGAPTPAPFLDMLPDWERGPAGPAPHPSGPLRPAKVEGAEGWEPQALQALGLHLQAWPGPAPAQAWCLSLRFHPQAEAGSRWVVLSGRLAPAEEAVPGAYWAGSPWLADFLAWLEAWSAPAWLLDDLELQVSL